MPNVLHDPLSIGADAEEIEAAKIEILKLPMTSEDGTKYLYSEALISAMSWAEKNFSESDSVDFSLLSGEEKPLFRKDISRVKTELVDLRERHCFDVVIEYLNFVKIGATQRQLKDWVEKYRRP